MSADQTAAELTTRDVLLQVDRRLTLIEGDLRSLDDKLDDKIDGLRHEFSTRLSDEIGGLRSEMNSRFARIDNKLWLQVGLTLTSGISLAALLVFK